MKSEHHLMERIRLGSESVKASLEFNKDNYRDSVLMHLQKMFNVRQGSCPTNPEYGLPDFNDLDMAMGFTSAVQEIAKAIKNHIENFEPGLSRVRVRHILDPDDPLGMRFEIIGKLNINGRSERIRFETQKTDKGVTVIS